MSLGLPLFDRAAFRYTIALDGEATYGLRFRWNARDSSWILSLYSADFATEIATGIRVVYGSDLLAAIQHLVPGSLTVREGNASDGSRPLRADFADLSGLVIEYTPAA